MDGERNEQTNEQARELSSYRRMAGHHVKRRDKNRQVNWWQEPQENRAFTENNDGKLLREMRRILPLLHFQELGEQASAA